MGKIRKCVKCGLGLTRRIDVAYDTLAGPICEGCKNIMDKESKDDEHEKEEQNALVN